MVKVGDIVTIARSPYHSVQEKVVYVYSSGMVMLKGETQPGWPVNSEKKNV